MIDQDPTCYTVTLEWVSVQYISKLLNIVRHVEKSVLIIQNKMCMLYRLPSDMVHLLNTVDGQSKSETNIRNIQCCYKQKGIVVLLNKSSNVQLITDEQGVAKVQTVIDIGREIGLYRKCHTLDLDEDEYRLGYRNHKSNSTSRIRPSLRSTLHTKSTSRTGSQRTRYLPQRHGTTPVFERPDNTDIYYGKRLTPDLDCVYPYTPHQYVNPTNSPGFRQDDNIKYSVQASDDNTSLDKDCFTSSFIPKYPLSGTHHSESSKLSSEIVTNVPSIRSKCPNPEGQRENAATGYDDQYRYRNNSHCDTPTSTGRESSVPSTFSRSRNDLSSFDQGIQTTNPQKINYKAPRHPEYASEHFRTQSFLFNCWNETTKPRYADMVHRGLYATGTGDLVRCYQCGLGLKDWAKDDDPLIEHLKYTKDCALLMDQLGAEEYRRLKETVDPTKVNERLTTLQRNETATTTRTASLPYPVHNPNYMTVDERLASYIAMPPHVTQHPRDLAMAGLYFTGEDDICRCFTCDGGLKNWVPGDDPMEEHAKFFPNCQFLRHLKGDAFVELVQQRLNGGSNGMVPTAVTPSHNPSSQPLVASTGQALGQMSLSHAPVKQNVDILRTPAAQSVLEMGYSEDVVMRSIKQLAGRGKRNPSAEDLIELILEYEEINGETNVTNAGKEDVFTENQKLKAMMKCILCNTAERNVLCLPCTHHRMCTSCARDKTHCPVCGKYIQQQIKTYMA